MEQQIIDIILVSIYSILGFIAIIGVLAGLGWAMEKDMEHYASGEEYSDNRLYLGLFILVVMIITISITVVLYSNKYRLN